MFAMRRLNRSFSRRLQNDRQQREKPMAVESWLNKKYIPGTTFGPETIKDMTTAFERIRRVLKLKDPDDPLIEVVAKKVISLACQGTLDPKEIECLVIANTKRT
jgi:hypothetical protein